MRRDTRPSAVVWLGPVALAVLLAGCTSGPASENTAATTSTPSGGVLAEQASYENVVNQVLPSVVQINTSTGLGSGVVYDSRGDIITNDHVVGQAGTFQVTLATGGPALAATLVGNYPASDLAVIRVSDARAVHPAKFGDSSKLRVGQLVLAMGSPLGLSASVTDGIVSAVGRTVGEPQESGSPGATITNAVQTSAAINPGNSGGALVDMSGQVIGIPTLGAVDPQLGTTAAGIGFAISSDTATRIADQLIKTGSVGSAGRAALDIQARSVLDDNLRPAGVGVVSVTPGGAAGKAGIQAGSVITSVNGTPTPSTEALSDVLTAMRPGQQVKVDLVDPGGNQKSVTVTLGKIG
ncbi:MAG TPA: trypsin-like peptidase domain-containing protein [Pseudonocardiaceae bacterium]|jgi:S1-C subfamily serine protease|nr:trypsin-like peptidase domain-containing protein [Pseudonocardiaceae bacterium]